VLLGWGAVLAAGIAAATQLTSVLANSFTVPGSESARAAALLAAHFGERPESTFVVVFPVRHPSDRTVQRRLQRRLDLASRAIPAGAARPLRRGGGVLYGDVVTRLGLHQARGSTDALRRSLGPGALVTGQPAIEHDLEPVLASDLRRGELIAVPVALLVLLAVLGFSWAVAMPFVFAACTIGGTLAAVYLLAHEVTTTTYVTNLVVLLGFGLAVDYSLLLVHRFREERDVARTMATAGRTVTFSGLAVAAGLSLLLLVPVPFVRSLGLGALLVPLLSVAAAWTLAPVLLSLLPPEPTRAEPRQRWERFARLVVRRRLAVFAGSTALLVALAVPALWLQLVPGSFSGLPSGMESARGLTVLRNGIGPGAVTPTEIVLPRADAARLAKRLFHDPEVLLVAHGSRPPYTNGSVGRVVVVGRHEYGAPHSQALVRRIRRLTTGAVGGGAPQGVDFLSAAYGAFPWLALAVVALTFFILLRAFRSVVLPLEAVLVNALTVAAVYGLLVIIFQWAGSGAVEGWIPIFLFATLFGLSMDYEVFVVMRIREGWDRLHDTREAVVHGLSHTGRIVTAAALVLVGALTGFVTGDVPGLRQLGVGLVLAVLLDATVVRLLLVPSLVALLGRRNWWPSATSPP
jgi:RND superfamily putative drug exporter